MLRFISWLLICLLPVQAWAFNPAVLFSTDKLYEGGLVKSAYQGVLSYQKYKSAQVKVLMPSLVRSPGMPVIQGMLLKAAQEGFNPIIAVGPEFKAALQKTAAGFPKTSFVLIDAVAQGGNIQSIVFREQEGAYLMGYLAAMASKSGKIGFVGGKDTVLTRLYACAFAQGASKRDQSISVNWLMAGDTDQAWQNPELGSELTRRLIKQGVDVVFHAADRTGLGVIKAAQKAHIKAIGIDSNQNVLAPEIMLTSLLKRTDVAMFMALTRAENNQLNPGVVSLGLMEGGMDWAVDENNIMLLTAEMEKELADLAFGIMAKQFRVNIYSKEKGCTDLDF